MLIRSSSEFRQFDLDSTCLDLKLRPTSPVKTIFNFLSLFFTSLCKWHQYTFILWRWFTVSSRNRYTTEVRFRYGGPTFSLGSSRQGGYKWKFYIFQAPCISANGVLMESKPWKRLLPVNKSKKTGQGQVGLAYEGFNIFKTANNHGCCMGALLTFILLCIYYLLLKRQQKYIIWENLNYINITVHGV